MSARAVGTPTTTTTPPNALFSPGAFLVFYHHSVSTRGMQEKEVQKLIQQANDHGTKEQQRLITGRMKILSGVASNIAALRELIMNNMHGERAVMCVTACWQAYKFHEHTGGPATSESGGTGYNGPPNTCCFAPLVHTARAQLKFGVFIQGRDDTVQMSPVFAFHGKWINFVKAVMLISRASDYVLLFPDSQKAALMNSLNSAAQYITTALPVLLKSQRA